ncbi:gamma-glutamyl-gamma-aminobutyrate hydrolase family protein [Breoghania sp. L-A4]|uniref:gamma-glutamyl-gamma-aminobutyrate hydrolase family protein n=1 Tax=Breoghania sp. L-A4 TaxID=2304600 RepID=UPI000E35E300|nr:gamma-glutamyl-gamma-aminobutyrate hydrolase family protein [Breoghania sp. L-A4]AXS41892.1 gamma-glutamyl-gamma-aminobutyrate hydrolase family protein [Breoghania sp. L-A4]
MPTPLVLVSADVRETDGYEWHAAPSTYLLAVLKGSEAIPVILPSLGPEIPLDDILDRVDGVLLTGARSNVNPELYGEVATEENGPYDPKRDATTLPLIRRTIERGVPLLAICRGMQELNVALGGTLVTEIQTLPGKRDHRAPPSDNQATRFGLAHTITPEPGSCIAAILGTGPVHVNSLHRQAVGTLGQALTVDALAEDGTVEAMRPTGAKGFALATQWHPEYWIASDDTSQKLFRAFGDAMRERMNARERSEAAE